MTAIYPQVLYEAKIYANLQCGGKFIFKVVGIPIVYWYGVEGDYNVMVMDLLGLNLEDLFSKENRQFSLKTVLIIIDQIVLCIFI